MKHSPDKKEKKPAKPEEYHDIETYHMPVEAETAPPEKSNYASTVRAKSAVVPRRQHQFQDDISCMALLQKIKEDQEKAEQRRIALRLKSGKDKQPRNHNVAKLDYIQLATEYLERLKNKKKKNEEHKKKMEREGKVVAIETFKDLAINYRYNKEDIMERRKGTLNTLKQQREKSFKEIEKKWKDQMFNSKQDALEDSENHKEHDEQTLRSGLARMRRKRLEQAHKMILIEKIQEKKNRQECLMQNNA